MKKSKFFVWQTVYFTWQHKVEGMPTFYTTESGKIMQILPDLDEGRYCYEVMWRQSYWKPRFLEEDLSATPSNANCIYIVEPSERIDAIKSSDHKSVLSKFSTADLAQELNARGRRAVVFIFDDGGRVSFTDDVIPDVKEALKRRGIGVFDMSMPFLYAPEDQILSSKINAKK